MSLPGPGWSMCWGLDTATNVERKYFVQRSFRTHDEFDAWFRKFFRNIEPRGFEPYDTLIHGKKPLWPVPKHQIAFHAKPEDIEVPEAPSKQVFISQRFPRRRIQRMTLAELADPANDLTQP